MGKAPAAIIVLVSAAVVAALFGAALSQLAYSVSAAHYVETLFPAHGMAESQHTRMGAALVGALDAWWVGALLVFPPLAVAFVMHPRGATVLTSGIALIGLGLVVALGGAFAGLAFGMATPVGEGVADGVRRASFMLMGAGYGGLAAVPIGLWTIWRTRRLGRG